MRYHLESITKTYMSIRKHAREPADEDGNAYRALVSKVSHDQLLREGGPISEADHPLSIACCFDSRVSSLKVIRITSANR